jgi:hypothetical protein
MESAMRYGWVNLHAARVVGCLIGLLFTVFGSLLSKTGQGCDVGA